MRATWAWAFTAAWATSACAPSDPCAQFSGQTCVALEVRGDAALRLDQLHLVSPELKLAALDPPAPGPVVRLPVLVPVLPEASFTGPFGLGIEALLGGNMRGRAQIGAAVERGAHVHVVAVLEGDGSGGGGGDGGSGVGSEGGVVPAGSDLAGVTAPPASDAGTTAVDAGRTDAASAPPGDLAPPGRVRALMVQLVDPTGLIMQAAFYESTQGPAAAAAILALVAANANFAVPDGACTTAGQGPQVPGVPVSVDVGASVDLRSGASTALSDGRSGSPPSYDGPAVSTPVSLIGTTLDVVVTGRLGGGELRLGSVPIPAIPADVPRTITGSRSADLVLRWSGTRPEIPPTSKVTFHFEFNGSTLDCGASFGSGELTLHPADLARLPAGTIGAVFISQYVFLPLQSLPFAPAAGGTSTYSDGDLLAVGTAVGADVAVNLN